MYFKRPSFRKGGNIGGGIMSGTDMGTRTGFQNPMIDFLNRNILGRNTQIGTTPLSNVSESVGIEQLLKGTDTRGSVNTTPQTVEELYKRRGEKLKRSGDYIGEIFSAEPYIDSEGNKRDRITGEIITSATTSSGIDQIVSEGAAGDQITMLSDEAKGAATEALLKSIEEKKKRVEPGSDDSSITLDPYEEIKKEKDFLSEMLKNEGLERGEIALIAAKAIGTEGSFKDKLDAAVALALPVVRRRNKEDKALTLTAYKAFKEKEAAQAKAGQDTTGIKDLKYQADILRKSGDPQYKNKSQEEVISIIIKDKFADADSATRIKILSSTNVAGEVSSRFDDLRDAKSALDNYIEKKGDKLKEDDKKLALLRKTLEEAKVNFNLFAKYPEFEKVYPTFVSEFTNLGLKQGGRVKRALGSPSTGEQIITTEAQTIGAETAEKPVLKLDYAQLRDRLPPEITDDVVQLLANSEEALQEFAYIQTQNDVDAFNLKYGVNLIIPPAPQTA
jgi:hypothetical protein